MIAATAATNNVRSAANACHSSAVDKPSARHHVGAITDGPRRTMVQPLTICADFPQSILLRWYLQRAEIGVERLAPQTPLSNLHASLIGGNAGAFRRSGGRDDVVGEVLLAHHSEVVGDGDW